eukprot:TRINITY_DN3538_c0_g1_i1.p1 TRINITY_DN3538_c0_g1~~TRINITY_DN3538_c0_g1_i1.p1  ORF type:complete len:187 (+),score=10.51 TRINITY_DN3538_c0_g1_i1:45-605(+)
MSINTPTLIGALATVPLYLALIRMREKDSAVPRFHPTLIYSGICLVRILLILPFVILAAVYKNYIWMIIGAVFTGLTGGGHQMILQILIGWVIDEDEIKGENRREGMFLACNGAIQHGSLVTISVIIALWGALGYNSKLCPDQQPKAVKDAIFGTFTIGNFLLVVLTLIMLQFFPIRKERLRKLHN